MFTRNKLVHLVIWPNGAKASISLLDPDGVIIGTIPCTTVTRGSELAKMIPEGFSIEPDLCSVVGLSGDISVATIGEFDTEIVLERTRPSLEDRLLQLERRARRHAAREQQERERNQALLEKMTKLKGKDDEVVDDVETPDPDIQSEDVSGGADEASTDA